MLKKALVFIFAVLVSTVIAANYAWNLPTENDQAVRVDVKPGATLSGLAGKWQRDGWLPSAALLKIQARILKKQNVLRVGEYDIPPHLSGPELLAFLATARPVSYKISLIEGTRLRDAIQAFKSAPRLVQDVQPLTVETIARLIDVSGNPEGWLYPDTYIYHSGEAVSSVIRQAHARMKKELDEAWKKRAKNLPYKNAYQALVMASIVEKETGAAHERPQIAGVFVRRLNKNMRLETDPTVIYGLGEQFNGNLRKKHLRDRTNPYNTYRMKGLPPSPIAFAGREAIHAALHPEDGAALYFVAKGDGSHYFSASLKEHINAVRKYQIFRRKKDYRSAPVLAN